jgi:polysaccharide biosynthesis protein PslH
MPKPHVLMLTPYLPYPPVSGGRMRSYNLIKYLSADYDISLVCFGRPEETALDYSPISAYCDVTVVDRDPTPSTIKAAILSLTSPKPITMRLYGTEAMRQACAQLLRDRPADVIHVESFYMLQNIPAGTNAPVLLSEPAIEYRAWGKHARVAKPWFTRPAIALEAIKMRFWSPREWRKADAVGAMSDIDAAEIKRFVPDERIVLAPNGVDVGFFQTNPDIERDSRTAVYMGDYKYFPNTDAVNYFAKEILPLIQSQRPDFHLTLLGKDPSPEIQALAGGTVTVTGLVDDTRPYLQGSAVFICPLRSGSGTRFKLMESLACGCPVVSTSLGCEGLGALDGVHMLIRDDAQSFADAVIDLLDNPQRGQAMGQAGREWVIEKHAWEHSAALIRKAYQRIINA